MRAILPLLALLVLAAPARAADPAVKVGATPPASAATTPSASAATAVTPPASAATPATSSADLPVAPAEVRLERVKPTREKYATLRFLRENRDFIRARYDRLREHPVDHRGEVAEIDPRFLTYRALLAQLDRSRDSVAGAEDARSRQALFASVGELAALETELDGMEAALHAQRQRLATLERDFTGHPTTEMLVVLSGLPADAELASITLELEDGGAITLPLGPAEREALRGGGLVEVLHAFVEPRAQVVRIGVAGSAWPSGDSGWLPLEPARDRLNVVRLDLQGLGRTTGITGIRAATWVHDSAALSIGG